MTMIGFPPALADRWSLANWQNAPYNRWSFQHLREVVPTARVGRGSGSAAAVARSGRRSTNSRSSGGSTAARASVAEVLADTFTDGFLVLHDGKVVTEQYPSGMSAPTGRTC